MNQYHTTSDGLKYLKKQTAIRYVAIMIISVALVIFFTTSNPDFQNGNVNILPFIISFILLIQGFGMYMGWTRLKKNFLSYCLTISETELIREQINTPNIILPFEEIRGIRRNNNGSLTVKGESKLNAISIPRNIENYVSIEEKLSKIIPITDEKQTVFSGQIGYILILLLTCCAFAPFFISTNIIVLGILGTVVIGILILTFIQLRKNKNVDRKSKAMIYVGMICSVIIIINIIMQMAK